MTPTPSSLPSLSQPIHVILYGGTYLQVNFLVFIYIWYFHDMLAPPES